MLFILLFVRTKLATIKIKNVALEQRFYNFNFNLLKVEGEIPR